MRYNKKLINSIPAISLKCFLPWLEACHSFLRWDYGIISSSLLNIKAKQTS
jgi:hypothetical protein